MVILLHGTAGSLENFSANYAAYAEHFRVIGLDMLGCGWTDKPDYDYLINHYAEHVRSFMDALGIDKAAVVGVSLGAWLAPRWRRHTRNASTGWFSCRRRASSPIRRKSNASPKAAQESFDRRSRADLGNRVRRAESPDSGPGNAVR